MTPPPHTHTSLSSSSSNYALALGSLGKGGLCSFAIWVVQAFTTVGWWMGRLSCFRGATPETPVWFPKGLAWSHLDGAWGWHCGPPPPPSVSPSLHSLHWRVPPSSSGFSPETIWSCWKRGHPVLLWTAGAAGLPLATQRMFPLICTEHGWPPSLG